MQRGGPRGSRGQCTPTTGSALHRGTPARAGGPCGGHRTAGRPGGGGPGDPDREASRETQRPQQATHDRETRPRAGTGAGEARCRRPGDRGERAEGPPDGPEQPIPRASKHSGLSCGLLHPRAPAAARRTHSTRGCLGPRAGRGPLLGPRPSGGPPPTQCPLTASSHIGWREAVYSHGYRDPREKSFRAVSPERAPRAPGCTVSLQFDRSGARGPSRAE